MQAPLHLRAAFGRYPNTEALWDGRVAPDGIALDLDRVEPISRAFAPMVRERRFQLSEMAIATFLQAKAWGKPVVLLPVTLAARFQQRAFIRRADGPVRSPADLRGRTVGVRAYSQTTGLWMRGALAEDYSLAPEDMRWVTFEDAHVAEYRDPAFVTRSRPGETLEGLLRAGEIDAAIFGAEVPSDPAFAGLFADPDAAAASFFGRYGFTPVNHLLVCDQDVAEAAAAPLVAAFRQAAAAAGPDAAALKWPQTRAALEAPIRLALSYCRGQGLLPRDLSLDEVWAGFPDGID